jgi:hypothetical protein
VFWADGGSLNWFFAMPQTNNRKTWPLSVLPGISEEQLQQLSRLNLHTTADLLQLTRSPQILESAAAKLQLPLRYLQKWAALSDLAQLPSVGGQHCGLLLHSGIASVNQLAMTAPGSLHTRIRKLHTMTMRRSDLCPTPDQVVCWVREAKAARGR